jgi:7-cyano-7-deazaguanine reductase
MSDKTIYQGLGQLGLQTAIPASPEAAVLERVVNPHEDTLYLTRFAAPEFTSLCPVTKQPDFASLEICYIADELCVETKSLKFYLASFRATPSFGEDVVNRILDDLVAVLKPRAMQIEAQFAPRGGISLSVDVEYPELTE